MKEQDAQAKLSLKLQAYQYLKTKILNCEYRPNEFLNEHTPGKNSVFPDTDFPLFRLADVYLMYAVFADYGCCGKSRT